MQNILLFFKFYQKLYWELRIRFLNVVIINNLIYYSRVVQHLFFRNHQFFLQIAFSNNHHFKYFAFFVFSFSYCLSLLKHHCTNKINYQIPNPMVILKPIFYKNELLEDIQKFYFFVFFYWHYVLQFSMDLKYTIVSMVKFCIQLVFYFFFLLLFLLYQLSLLCWRFGINNFVTIPISSNIIKNQLAFSFELFKSWAWILSRNCFKQLFHLVLISIETPCKVIF